jgi:hypothetical protein
MEQEHCKLIWRTLKGEYIHTPAHQHAFARKIESFSSVMGFAGTLLASRVAAEAFKY